MQKLNICHILEDGRFGGPHKLFVNLISKTNVNYRNSAVFFRHQSAKFETEIKKYKIKYKIFDLPYLSKTSIFNYFLYFIKFYKSFIKNYEICNNDYFVVHQPNKSFISIVTLILLKKKIIFYFHDNYSNFIFKFIIEFFFKNKICGCIFSSYSSLNFYKKFKKIKKEIIYSSAKKSKFNKKKSKKKFIIGTCSNISPIKNIIFFLKIAETFKKHEDIEFKILGNYWDSQRNYFNKCLNFKKERKLKNVNFIINSNNYEKLFSGYDLYLCTSISESCPVSIIEAMEKKIPIISTDVGDVSKILNLNKNKCGDVVDLNLQSFNKKILKYKNNKPYYNKISKACYKNYKKNFTLEKYNMKFKNFLHDVNKSSK